MPADLTTGETRRPQGRAYYSVDIPTSIPVLHAIMAGGGDLLSSAVFRHRSLLDAVGHATATGAGALVGSTLGGSHAAGAALAADPSRPIRQPTNRMGMDSREAAEFSQAVGNINSAGWTGSLYGSMGGSLAGGLLYDSLVPSADRGVLPSARQTLYADPETLSAAEVIQRKTSSWSQTLAVLGGGALAGVLGSNVGHEAGLAAAPLFPSLDPDTLARAGTFAVGVPSAHLGSLLTGAALRPEIAEHVTAANLPRIAAGVYDPASNKEQEASDAFAAKRKGQLVA